ncbi:MAG: NUDIX hydrolase [Lentimicrobiaceae bacterium]
MTYTYQYPRPAVTVDALVFRNTGQGPQILLIKRGNPPFQGMWAIPGGFVEMDETLETAAQRELQEETGISGVSLKQYGAYGAINRDPRHRTISVAYAGLLTDPHAHAEASDDAADCEWFYLDRLPETAFDHKLLIEDAIGLARQQQWI